MADEQSMVERVARAISGGVKWQMFEAQARAAIKAMREPTEDMLDAGEGVDITSSSDTASPVWDTMISAALAEPPHG